MKKRKDKEEFPETFLSKEVLRDVESFFSKLISGFKSVSKEKKKVKLFNLFYF